MNLELIRKYKEEFNHYINGGLLIALLEGEDENWFSITENTSIWNKEYPYAIKHIIINDKYVEFRKALAEGKTIESNFSIMGFGCPNKWVNMSNKFGYKFEHSPKCYRIKVEEPKLKIGDYVTVTGPAGTFIECISGINDDTYTLSRTDICYKSQTTKWEPKKGEICIFWDNDDICSATIVRFDCIKTNGQYRSTDNSWWDNCIPFEGKLPLHMMEN